MIIEKSKLGPGYAEKFSLYKLPRYDFKICFGPIKSGWKYYCPSAIVFMLLSFPYDPSPFTCFGVLKVFITQSDIFQTH